jgi:hypothetical protein
MNQVAASTALLALILLAGVSDLRTRRIPNALTVTALGIALALRGATGVEPLASGLAGAVIAFATAIPLVLLGGLGGGDAKMLAATGAFLGPAGLPQEVVTRWTQALAKAGQDKATVDLINATGCDVDIIPPAQTVEKIRADAAKWGKVVKDAKIKAE